MTIPMNTTTLKEDQRRKDAHLRPHRNPNTSLHPPATAHILRTKIPTKIPTVPAPTTIINLKIPRNPNHAQLIVQDHTENQRNLPETVVNQVITAIVENLRPHRHPATGNHADMDTAPDLTEAAKVHQRDHLQKKITIVGSDIEEDVQ